MLPPLSVQLYSLRAEAAVDLEAVVRRIGRAGYVGVEPAGLHGMEPDTFASIVSDSGLVVSSSHSALPVGSQSNAILDEQETIGNRFLINGSGPDDFVDRGAIERLASVFNEAAANAGSRGMQVGYHNHWWEFDHTVDGELPYDVLQSLLDPAVFAEVDIYWVQVGGHDPAAVIGALGNRARFLHVKDGPLDPPSPMTAAGEGKVDLDAALAAGGFVEWHVVELDACATDMFEAVEQSQRYLVGRGLSSGR